MKSLSVDQIHEVLNDVADRHLEIDPRRLQANPIIDAVGRIYNKLREAIDDVCLNGVAVLEAARDAVVAEWDDVRSRMSSEATQILDRIQRMVADLVQTLVDVIVSAAPRTLKDGAAVLEEFSISMSLSASPSVGVAAQKVLELAASTGTQINFVYRLTDQSAPSPNYARGLA